MKPYQILIITTVAMSWGVGCQASSERAKDMNTVTPGTVNETVSQVTTTDVSDDHMRVIDLITAGETARLNDDVKTLLETAQALRDMGAHPVSGTEDLAKNWTVIAERMRTNETPMPPFRGRIKGPAYQKKRLAPAGSETIEDIYYAAEPAELTLKTLDGSQISWSVYDDSNSETPLCHNQAAPHTQSCHFTPLWTAKYKIRIVNSSSQDATYLFITN